MRSTSLTLVGAVDDQHRCRFRGEHLSSVLCSPRAPTSARWPPGSIGEVFRSLVMRLHGTYAEEGLKLIDAITKSSAKQRSASVRHTGPRGGWRAVLMARQLEVAFLVREGLYQDEVAACLSISRRQVERLLQQTRERSVAATTSELVAMLVRSPFVPPPRDGIWCEDLTELAGRLASPRVRPRSTRIALA